MKNAPPQNVLEKAAMKLKIGVMDGAGNDIPENYLQRVCAPGEEIANASCILVTRACPGPPLAAARGDCHRDGMIVLHGKARQQPDANAMIASLLSAL